MIGGIISGSPGDASAKASSIAELGRYISLTIAIAGLQFCWAVETGFGSPYLLSLGLKKSLVSLVWLAGPLSGLITQPLVGIFSDRCTSRFGRRRPFIVGSVICTILCLTVVGWTREIAGGHETLTIWMAVISFYFLDFAINALQGSLRSLIVDVLPAARQDAGTAWAARMIGIGNVSGYLMGFLDLASLLPFLGSTHMQILTTIASVMLAITVSITCYCTSETPIPPQPSAPGDGLRAFTSLYTSLGKLPTVIKDIFRIELFAWIGWFPFLFYGTTYIADLYVAAHEVGDATDVELMERGTRAGSLAMFAHAVVSLSSSLILPLFSYSLVVGRPPHPQLSNATVLGRLKYALLKVRAKVSVSLPTMWAISLVLFSVAMVLTLAASSVAFGSVLIAVCGIAWAVVMWIPFSMIGESIRITSSQQQSQQEMRDISGNGSYMRVSSDDIAMEVIYDQSGHDAELDRRGSEHSSSASEQHTSHEPAPSYHEHEPGYHRPELDNNDRAHDEEHDKHMLSAGTILGVHNVSCVIPQFVSAFTSSLIFAVFEHIQGTGPDEVGGQHAQQIALVMCLGGISAAGGAYFSWKLGC
ncbi:hypothetical protein H4S08_002134 [Coemansia sp. RSA 1365]|nr:hypothetical protein H4S08_002134 [Coemansia sp. RSA 1365]